MPDHTEQRSRAHFARDYCCSESVLLALVERYGIDPAPVMPLASGFCGGMAGSRQVCGAVSGAVMAVGLVLADGSPPTNRAQIESVARQFMDAFSAQYGSVACGALLQIQRTEAAPQPPTRCADYVGGAVRLALEVLPAIIQGEDS